MTVLCTFASKATVIGCVQMCAQVVKGSLTQQAVTAIVNPTNGTLGVNGGVSNHIAGKLEPGELEKQCKAAIKELPAGQHCVPVGGTAVTECSKAGRKKLQCRYIIHAVGPHGKAFHSW